MMQFKQMKTKLEQNKIIFGIDSLKSHQIFMNLRRQTMQEQLDSLICKATNQIMTQYPVKYYQESAFNEKFDIQLAKLVIDLNFNFHIIAFHLQYLFPQFYYKITYKSVCYRWGQLHAQKYPKYSTDKRESDIWQDKQLPRTGAQISQQKQLIKKRNEQQRKVAQEKLKIALEKAQQLDQQELERLIIYRPKFIIDNSYKLERQDLDSGKVQNFMNNQSMFDFGNFDNLGQLAGRIQLEENQNLFQDINPNPKHIAVQRQVSNHLLIQKQQKQTYIDDDWQAYQSD